MTETDNLFFELIRVAIGNQVSLSRVPSTAEWTALYGLSVKQAVAGVCFCGVQRLPKEQVDSLPMSVKMEWLGRTVQIQQQNELLNKRVREVSALFSEGGFRSCVLKGQGVAKLYCEGLRGFQKVLEGLRGFKRVSEGQEVSEGFRRFQGGAEGLNDGRNLGLYRQSGDIDLWVDGEREQVIDFLKGKGWKVGRTVVHHTDVEIFPDVSLEVHHFPSFSFSPFRWRKYREWFRIQTTEQFQLKDYTLGFCHPSIEFNLVYCLLHIFRHVFHEGIGLRQLMDNYMVLMAAAGGGGAKELQKNAMHTLERFGLVRFTAAVMYVEREVFGLQEEYMLCKPDEKAGKYLLEEIMRAGNFGQYDPRIRDAHYSGMVMIYMKNFKRIFGMVRYYPSEVLWAPFWKVGHFVWRKVKGYK